MLQALSRALASTLAVARSERAGGQGAMAVADAMAGSSMVCWDVASINIITLALRQDHLPGCFQLSYDLATSAVCRSPKVEVVNLNRYPSLAVCQHLYSCA